MDNYIFAAIFEPNGTGGYGIYFPDIPGCISCGNNLEEAMLMAEEALELHLFVLEEDNEPIPQMTNIENIDIPKNCFVVPIKANMRFIRNKMSNKAVKKTLTIPYWLNKEAEIHKINFSQVLQSALKNELNIK